MNNFVITVGGYCSNLSDAAINTASSLGIVKVNMGGTACKVLLASEYIIKMHNRGTLGKKRKSARC
jgi:soluble P-type ATPase